MMTPLLFDPGEKWEYGANIDWCGQVVESIRGKRLGEVFRERIFDPLGMKDIAFSLTPSMRDRLARMHLRKEDGSLTPPRLRIAGRSGGAYGRPRPLFARSAST